MLPIEKKDRAVKLLQEMIDKKKATVKELQILCGFLNFLGKSIFPGRTFTRRMYSKFSHVMNAGIRNQNQEKPNYKLLQYHHVRIDQEFRDDCKTWLEFLTGELHKVVNRLMVDIQGMLTTSEEIKFYSDASASKKLSSGSILNDRWIQGFWGEDFITKNKPNIEYLELIALCAGILTWENEDELKNRRITIFCDNMTVVHMINNLSAKCPN